MTWEEIQDAIDKWAMEELPGEDASEARGCITSWSDLIAQAIVARMGSAPKGHPIPIHQADTPGVDEPFATPMIPTSAGLEAVKIKPLLWDHIADARFIGGYRPHQLIADIYTIKRRFDVYYLDDGHFTFMNCEFDTVEAAQAAAQADFEARIRSALIPPSRAEEPVAWRVKDYADGWMYFTAERNARDMGNAMHGALVEPLYAEPSSEVRDNG